MPLVSPIRLLLLLVLALALTGCGPKQRAADISAHHAHEHAPKHGGVLAELGEEEFHLEFAFGNTPGVLQAYVMDAHVEDYVRINASSFAVTATIGDQTFPLTFQAIASTETGESVGDTALFEARSDSLIQQRAIKLTIPTITVKGRTFTGVTAELPAR
jgi:hypothetical protein